MIAIGLIRELSRLGVLVGRYPVYSILIGLLLLIPGLIGLIFRFQLDPALNEGLVSSNAPSHREIADQQSFFGRKGRPFYMALFGETNGNMLEDKTFNEMRSFFDNTMTMNLSVDGETYFQFRQLCNPLCGINDQVQQLMDYSFFATLKYPVSEVLGFDVNIGKHVYHRNISEKGILQGAKMLAFFYTALITDETSRDQLQFFERSVTELAQLHNVNSSRLVNLTVHGTNTVGEEIKKGVQETMLIVFGCESKGNTYSITAAVASVLFMMMVVSSSWCGGNFGCHRLFLGMLPLFLAPLAVSSGIGLLCLIGVKINMLFIMAPIGTLVFLSHLHNVLHMLRTFDNTETDAKRNQYNRSERLSATYEQMASANIITNLGLIFGFAAARFFLSQSYGQYSLAVAISLLLLWILEVRANVKNLLVFGAFLSLSCNASDQAPKYYEPHNKKRNKCMYECSVQSSRLFIRPFSTIVTSIPGRLIGIICIGLLIGLPIQMGLRELRSDMNFRNFLPLESPANRGFDMMDEMWNSFHQIVFIINRPPNFTDPNEYAVFRKFIAEVEAVPNALNASAQMSWIFDYYRSELKMDYHSPNASLNPPDMSKFNDFITGFPYQAWAHGIRFEFLDEKKVISRYNNTKVPKINKMLVMGAFHKIVGLNGKRELINRCRKIALNYPQMQISAFDTDSRTVDIMENVLPTFYKWSLVLLIAMTIVPLVTLWNLAASLLCFVGSAFVLTTSHALCGLLLGFPLDLLNSTMIITMCAVGLRIAVHFIGEFLLVWAHDDRVARAMQSSSGVVLKITLLTSVFVVPLIFLTAVPLFTQFASASVVGIGASMLTSFVLLPFFAGFLPTRIISLETCC
ncbi:hypothetical protein M3Y98_01146000 [Aphelenchoides besseyi]|nr:hypothetical protein M3Y98_01146000 [Aphelenchoides besseyi]